MLPRWAALAAPLPRGRMRPCRRCSRRHIDVARRLRRSASARRTAAREQEGRGVGRTGRAAAKCLTDRPIKGPEKRSPAGVVAEASLSEAAGYARPKAGHAIPSAIRLPPQRPQHIGSNGVKRQNIAVRVADCGGQPRTLQITIREVRIRLRPRPPAIPAAAAGPDRGFSRNPRFPGGKPGRAKGRHEPASGAGYGFRVPGAPAGQRLDQPAPAWRSIVRFAQLSGPSLSGLSRRTPKCSAAPGPSRNGTLKRPPICRNCTDALCLCFIAFSFANPVPAFAENALAATAPPAWSASCPAIWRGPCPATWRRVRAGAAAAPPPAGPAAAAAGRPGRSPACWPGRAPPRAGRP